MKVIRYLILTLLVVGCSSDKAVIERNGTFYAIAKDGTSNKPFSGELLVWHDNGKLRGKATIKDGKPDGPYAEYYEDGLLIKKKGAYKGEKKVGPWEEYYDNGQLNFKGTYKNGKEHGLFEMYHENGQLEYKETFKDGERID